jgi:hypothetical protein
MEFTLHSAISFTMTSQSDRRVSPPGEARVLWRRALFGALVLAMLPVAGLRAATGVSAPVGSAVAAVSGTRSPTPDEAERLVRRDAATVRRAAAALVAAQIGRPFETIERRIPGYGDWVYGWVSSIWVSIELFGVGVSTATDQVSRGAGIDTQAITRDLEAFVVDAFERQVIAPDQTERDLMAAWRSVVERVKDLDRRLAEERRAEGVSPAQAQPLLAAWSPPPPPALMAHKDAILSQDAARFDDVSLDPAHADLVLRRSVRPLSIRVLSASTRLVIVPALVPMVGGVALFDAGGFVGATAFSAVVVAGLWGTDYALNWWDSAWNRPDFEAELRSVIRTQRDRTITTVRAHLDASLCALGPTTGLCR